MNRLRVQETVWVHQGLLHKSFLANASHLTHLACLWRELSKFVLIDKGLVDCIAGPLDVDPAWAWRLIYTPFVEAVQFESSTGACPYLR